MDRIGSYALRSRLVESVTGEIYEADKEDLERPVLVEVLREELTSSDAVREKLEADVPRVKRLAHANLTSCLELLQDDGRLAVVSESVDGRNLRHLLDEGGRLAWEEATQVAYGVARGLAAAHGAGPAILHGELRPERIFVSRAGSVLLLGVGIPAAMAAAGPVQARAVQMLRYLSPEQIDAGELDERSDLYGLGLLLYELLAGFPPFQSSSMRTLANMQCTEPPVALPPSVLDRIPKGLHELLLALLQKAPASRPPRASQVMERLEAFASARARELIARRVAAVQRSDRPGVTLAGSRPAAATDGGSARGSVSAQRLSSDRTDATAEQGSASSSAPSSVPATASDRAERVARSAVGPRWLRWPSELSTRQAVLIVGGFTVVAALLAYSVRACGDRDPEAVERPDRTMPHRPLQDPPRGFPSRPLQPAPPASR